MDTVIATATAAVPIRRNDTFNAVDFQGYQNLIRAASAARVRRIVYVSVPLSAHTGLSPLFQAKRKIEQRLLVSGLDCVIFRADIFMDVAFTMMGSAVPLRGSEAAAVLRPFGFISRYFNRIKNSIEQKHLALIPGNGASRHA